MPLAETSPNKSSQKGKRAASTRAKSKTAIKYTDKSPGQPDLVPIFDEIKKLLMPYEKGTMQLFASPGQVVLISKRPVEILGRKKEEVWFASALVQKGFVGFYYMPLYGDAKVKELIKPALLKCLKGKACFHIKEYDTEMFLQIKEALKVGYSLWHKRGWV